MTNFFNDLVFKSGTRESLEEIIVSEFSLWNTSKEVRLTSIQAIKKVEIPSEMSKYRQNLHFLFVDKIKLISDFDFEQFLLNLIRPWTSY